MEVIFKNSKLTFKCLRPDVILYNGIFSIQSGTEDTSDVNLVCNVTAGETYIVEFPDGIDNMTGYVSMYIVANNNMYDKAVLSSTNSYYQQINVGKKLYFYCEHTGYLKLHSTIGQNVKVIVSNTIRTNSYIYKTVLLEPHGLNEARNVIVDNITSGKKLILDITTLPVNLTMKGIKSGDESYTNIMTIATNTNQHTFNSDYSNIKLYYAGSYAYTPFLFRYKIE